MVVVRRSTGVNRPDLTRPPAAMSTRENGPETVEVEEAMTMGVLPSRLLQALSH